MKAYLVLCVILTVTAVLSLGSDHQNELVKRIEKLESREDEYVSMISVMKRWMLKQDTRIKQLEQKSKRFQATVSNLYDTIESLVAAVQTKIPKRPSNKVENSSSTFVNDDAVRKHDFHKAHAILKTGAPTHAIKPTPVTSKPGNRVVRQSDRSLPDSVAFHAVNEDSTVDHIGLKQNIPFPVVKLNVGNGYHASTSVFTAPTAGIYVFSSSLINWAHMRYEVQATIVRNGNSLARIYCHGGENESDQGSVTVTVQLQASDDVWVRYDHPVDGSIGGNGFASFTGFRLISL